MTKFMKYWLMKSEPEAFSIDDLKKCPGSKDHWDGVRNYQARNFMRQMKKGDLAFFYHSNCKPPGIIGLIEVVREAYPDPTQFDIHSKYYDPKSKTDNPRWSVVDVKFKEKFSRLISLDELKQNPKLKDMQLLRPGNRLSVMEVTEQQFLSILDN